MSLRFKTTSCSNPSLHRVLGGLLLLSLLLTVMAPSTNGQPESIEPLIELRCLCVKTVSGIHPSKISTLEVIKAGSHCSKVQVIATLKEGQKVCLNPDAPGVKKMIQKTLEG
ncbi:platelet basic protein-like [Fukomys damarensis]|uniref:platelet basic protein-like n=1 Tax=Fukomys damarensis TaxID=885580 RepID=UPI00053F75F0|nr:platelet basic protein-like [Fukomys damarensis]